MVKSLSFQYNTTRERQTESLLCFPFQYSIYDTVANEFHHLEYHQLFHVRIPCLNLGIESENNEHIIYAEKSRVYLTLIFWKIGGLFHFFVKFQVEVHGSEGTGYMVSSLGYRVHGLEGTGVWLREYGYTVSMVLGYRVRVRIT